MSVNEFFTQDFLNWLKDDMFLYIRNIDLRDLFIIATNDDQYMDLITIIFLKKDIQLNQRQFDYIMSNNLTSEKFMNTYIKYINSGLNSNKMASTKLIFSNDKLINLFLNSNINNINYLKYIFSCKLEKNVYLILLSNAKFKNAFLNLDYLSFFNFVNEHTLENEIPELINEKIQSLKYEEIIYLLERKYDVVNNKPDYLSQLYYQYEEELKKFQLKQLICSLKINSNEELKEKIKDILNTQEGMDIFLSQIIEPRFSEILNVLNMGDEYKTLRKNNLLNKLNNYEQYDLDTVKNLFSLYCFDDISYNIKLRLKTLLEYAKEDEEIKEKYSNEIAISAEIYKFLVSNELSINPIELVNYSVILDINLVIRELHSKFSHDVNQKTDISNILGGRTSSDKVVDDGYVKVYDLSDLPIEQSYFLIHSVSSNALGDNPLENYTRLSEKYNRICMSLFDNNHITNFLSGDDIIVFGYSNLSNPIYSATTFDGQTNQRSTYVSASKPQYRSTLTNLKKFMDRTNPNSYNELTYFTDKNLVLPSYIFVSNREPKEIEYKIAKEFNIPIVIYRTKKISFECEEGYGYNSREDFDYSKSSIDIISNNIKENNLKL